MAYEKDPAECGALWEKTSSKGRYLSGMVNGQAVVVFTNTKKKPGTKMPDWLVLKPTPREEREDRPADEPAKPTPAPRPAAGPMAASHFEDESDPF